MGAPGTRGKRFALGLILLAALLAGCGPTTAPAPEQAAVSEPLVWPAPPAFPRVRFLKTVARPADLGVTPSFWERIGRIILGPEEDWLIRPAGVAVSGPVIYVADPGAQALWVLDAQAGRFRKIQKARQRRLVSPVGVAIGHDRTYLSDSFLATIFVFDRDLKLFATIADPGWRRPAGLAFDASRDRLYVADSAAHRVWIHSGDGRQIGAIGQRGTGPGEFNFPTHVAVDPQGGLYVTDSLGFRVQVFEADGRFAASFGRHGDSAGDFAMPKGAALDSKGHIYVVDAMFDTVQIFDRQGRYLLAFGERGIRRGQFWLPTGIFIDPDDRIYVADSYNQRIQIFQYLAGGPDE